MLVLLKNSKPDIFCHGVSLYIVVDGAIWRMWSFGPYALFGANVPIETRAFRW